MQKKLFLCILAITAILFLVFFRQTAKQNQSALSANVYTPQSSTVIIDAGHGGMDGGAVAGDGTLEKTLNLSIAQKLNDLLQCAGVRTVLTRKDDNSIHDADAVSVRQQKVSDIHNRLQIMEQTENAVFVSIHQNHFSVSKYHGAQVFYSANDPQSAILAEQIRQSLTAHLQPNNTRETKKSGTEIYLLYHAMRPAVMVECGFLSNAEETQKLKTEDYQTKLALSVADGILNFFSSTEEV